MNPQPAVLSPSVKHAHTSQPHTPDGKPGERHPIWKGFEEQQLPALGFSWSSPTTPHSHIPLFSHTKAEELKGSGESAERWWPHLAGCRPDTGGSSDTIYAFECDEISNPDSSFPSSSRSSPPPLPDPDSSFPSSSRPPDPDSSFPPRLPVLPFPLPNPQTPHPEISKPDSFPSSTTSPFPRPLPSPALSPKPDPLGSPTLTPPSAPHPGSHPSTATPKP